MSIASPTLRSSSSTLPWPSCNNWATERLARPSTAEMLTGTSKTGARSVALFSSSSPASSASGPSPGANSSSFISVLAVSAVSSTSGVSDMAWLSGLWGVGGVGGGGSRAGDQGFGVQALGGQRGVQGLGDAFGGGGGVEARRAVPEIEGEGVRPKGGVGADLDGARIADRL